MLIMLRRLFAFELCMCFRIIARAVELYEMCFLNCAHGSEVSCQELIIGQFYILSNFLPLIIFVI